jgi:hypothetical protein
MARLDTIEWAKKNFPFENKKEAYLKMKHALRARCQF